MQTSPSIAKLAPAMVKASAAIEGAAKSGDNDHFKSKYVTLESVIEATRKALADNELCVIQAPGKMEAQYLTMTTRLLHSSGEWIEVEYQIPLAKADPQASGSAITYARRYALMALLNVPAVDDDAEGAMSRASAKITAEQAKELEALMVKSGVKPAVVLASVGVKTLAEIPASELPVIRTKLEARLPQPEQKKAA